MKITLQKNLNKRIDFIITKGNEVLSSGGLNEFRNIEVDYSTMNGFKTSALSFIQQLYTKNHLYYEHFDSVTKYYYCSSVNSALEILYSIKTEIENGWLFPIKSIVSAEIFSDFMEMAEHLLQKDYNDPAAVMIGSVLEEHLRQLCSSNGIETTIEKNDKIIPLKADRLNNELGKAEIYNKLDQKNITALLDLRNKAAHGKYSEYDKNQVELMYSYVMNLMSRNPI